jgi:hypothetical protein
MTTIFFTAEARGRKGCRNNHRLQDTLYGSHVNRIVTVRLGAKLAALRQAWRIRNSNKIFFIQLNQYLSSQQFTINHSGQKEFCSITFGRNSFCRQAAPFTSVIAV